ncbi:hypothetical protein [Bailinhaonella thermotolerans]|uniref:hypothetical protein n=1 Tax=Bailinhaonella thermotolerans TaxID=1070861 RepID=UPI0011C499C3|nr:hypothetical protein [Bailinhaonella thermotolerans]
MPELKELADVPEDADVAGWQVLSILRAKVAGMLAEARAHIAARSADATLDWLRAHGHADLAGAIFNVHHHQDPGRPGRPPRPLQGPLPRRHRRPLRPHLVEDAEIDLTHLSPAAHTAYLELAATIAAAFPRM